MLRGLSCFLGVSSCLAASAIPVEDNSALVQEAVRTHQHQASSEGAGVSRSEMLASLMEAAQAPAPKLPPPPKLPELKLPALKLPELKLPPPGPLASQWLKPFDCGKYPLLCKPPFNCQNWNAVEMVKFAAEGMAPDGKANLRSWCAFPSHEKYLDACIVQKDLVKAAQIQYAWATEQQNGIDGMDGSYCFIEGHCTNALVTNETTLEDTYEMCDSRFQRQNWAKFGAMPEGPFVGAKMADLPSDWSEGLKDPVRSRYFVQASCAMGTFHCDVMYCKETYCKNPVYVHKFGHLLPKAPGHLIQFRGRID